ncbi:hypothetical protein K3495_g2303 [Podosphaera aphanis]|nr:hypothetical protein K3495_g2303 [Podosphaera aphanis]
MGGFRYRELKNSNWRGRSYKDTVDKERQTISTTSQQLRHNVEQHQSSSREEDGIPLLTCEEFDGKECKERKPTSARCMSVLIGYDKEKKKSSDSDIDEFGEEGLTLESYLNTSNSKKRERPMDIDNLLNDDESSAKMQKKGSKRTRRAERQLREIVGRLGKGPVNYRKLAEEIKMEVSLMDLFQISPDMSKAFRKLSTRVNELTMKERMRNELPKTRRETVNEMNDDNSSEVLFGKAAGPLEVSQERAFRIPVTVKAKKDGKHEKVTLPISVAQADQESDMVIVTVGFLEKFGLPVKTLSSRGMNGLTMNVADDTLARLTQYPQFEIGVLGI